MKKKHKCRSWSKHDILVNKREDDKASLVIAVDISLKGNLYLTISRSNIIRNIVS